MSAPAEDWASVIQRLLDADQLALRKVTRLLNFFPIRWRAFDFREEREQVDLDELGARDGGAP